MGSTTEGQLISTYLPEDFGTSGYAKRRGKFISKHLCELPEDKEDLLELFDYWLEPSNGLRQYLWCHRPEDIENARSIIRILTVEEIKRILKYLIGNYWKRYIGWPDLLVYRENGYFYAEVKSHSDKLSEAQKNWIDGNTTELKLPFKLVKVRRA